MSEVKFNEFIAIVKRLRKECPWDREQTNDSIKANTLEEAYEVVHAIDEGNYSELKKELGDLLLHVVFHTIMAEEKKEFTIYDVIDSITEKLIRRHPHVFGETEVSGSSEVKKNWETIKLAEGRTSLLEGIPSDLPALLKAHRIQEKASKVGFDWSHKDEVWKKVTEEISELHEAEEKGKKEKTEEEFGDLLFALANYSRFIHVNPEDALRKSTAKFMRRFRYIEDELRKKDIPLPEAGLKLMDELWEESKKKEIS
ncbi:MAG: Nucleoside triphosphate pyrophosphohydrolase [Ignavibacteriaceae bacterium]|nr:Nucleoside triphosphate pyrophosphohydrolase [Ignavibacteriaceae bacterium]